MPVFYITKKMNFDVNSVLRVQEWYQIKASYLDSKKIILAAKTTGISE